MNLIPSNYITQSEEEGYDWKHMILYESDIEKATQRDTKYDVEITQNKLSDDFQWASFGKAGKRIMKLIKGIDPNDEMGLLDSWLEYLNMELSFPIAVRVTESEYHNNIQYGDNVSLESLDYTADMRGIIASIRSKRSNYNFPLCDLEVIDETNKNFQILKDYCIWFANR
ncbi:MAG: calcium-binding protein [Marinifilaceae bacterium]|nr:calcium-binding protein [Marinifilaceae bacterium]